MKMFMAFGSARERKPILLAAALSLALLGIGVGLMLG